MDAILFIGILFIMNFVIVCFLEILDKHFEKVIKRLFCIHKYQPMEFSSHLDKDNKKYDTWYVFECTKCHKEKIFKTYGIDKILNVKEIK